MLIMIRLKQSFRKLMMVMMPWKRHSPINPDDDSDDDSDDDDDDCR